MKKKIRIALIDTYVNIWHDIFSGVKIHIPESYDGFASANLTHGDLVCSVIVKECKDVEIVVYPLFRTETYEADVSEVIETLKSIRKEAFDIINLSMGTSYTDFYEEFKEACDLVQCDGTILVSAFDNSGMLSLPAVYKSVIGVDVGDKGLFGYEFCYEENSVINIRGGECSYRINIDKKFILAKGSSFFAPYITGIIARWMYEKDEAYSFAQVKSFLKSKAKKTNHYSDKKQYRMKFDIKRAIVLPFNKENRSMARFTDSLEFEITNFYDFKHFLQCGRHISELINVHLKRDYIIKNINKIDWEEDFDTVIIGHVSEIVNIIGDFDVCNLIKQCMKYQKNIYAYDDYILKKYSQYINKDKFFYPGISSDMLPTGRYGKLWDISSPVLGVFGTRAQQGKFTMQQMLRKRLRDLGYNCGYLCTEPSGYLLGADAVFAYGYNSSVQLCEQESVIYLNELLHEVDMAGYDIIITGGQSGVVPFDIGNMSRVLVSQTSFMFGANPDAVVMCASCDDSIEYIGRSIRYIESGCEAKVISIMLFPIVKRNFFIGQFREQNMSCSAEYEEKKRTVAQKLSIPTFGFEEQDVASCVESVVDFFAG